MGKLDVSGTLAHSDAADTYKANVAGIESALTDIKGTGWVDENLVSIQAYVDDLEARLSSARAALLDELGTPSKFKADVSSLATQTSVTAIKTTVDDTNTKVDNINLDTDAVIAKWDTYKASDIIGYVDNVESRLGAPTDASTADSVFGDIKALQEKWGSYAASDIYDITAGVTVVPYTVSNEVLTAATDAYSQLEALRAEVRALGNTAPAYEALLALQTFLSRVNAALEKLEVASTHPLYAQVLELANQLKATGVVKGGEKVMSLYEVSAKQAEDIEYLKKKLKELKAVAELSKEIMAEKKKERKKAIIKTNW